MTSIRLPVSLFLSVLATVALFWCLGVLMTADPRGDLIPVIREIQIAPTLIPEYPEPIPEPVRPPPPKPQPPSDDFDLVVDAKNVVTGKDTWKVLPSGVIFGEKELAPGKREEAGIPNSSGSDRGPVPRVRIEPEYPLQARDRGIEGWVRFSYTVARDGRVKDVAILDAQPARIWDRATIRAVSAWKFEPAIQDGVPVEQVGLVATYRFELER